MITLSDAILAKINNPIQLPVNNGEPILIFWISNPAVANGAIYTQFQNYVKDGTITSVYDGYNYSANLTMLKGMLATSNFMDNSMFQPGARINLFVKFGETSTETPIGLFCGTIDEVD